MRKDLRDRTITLINEFRGDSTEVKFKDFIRFLSDNNELNLRAHLVHNKYMFGSIVKESLET